MTNAFILRLMEFEGTDAERDPFTIGFLLSQATDFFAMQTDAFWYAWSKNLASGDTSVCAPMLYKLRSVNFLDGSGLYHPMFPQSTATMEARNPAYSWKNRPSQINSTLPPLAVVDGMNSIRLSPGVTFTTPVPTGFTNPAVEFEGYAVPSKCFKGDGVTPLFALPTDECPLNPVCHQGIVAKAMELRILQRPTEGMNAARLPLIQAEIRDYLGSLASFAFNFVPDYRFQQTRYRWR